MLPVHCIVELLDNPPSKDGGDAKKREEEEKRKEGYAIVPSTLQLRDLVRVALSKLDYPPERAKNATGNNSDLFCRYRNGVIGQSIPCIQVYLYES